MISGSLFIFYKEGKNSSQNVLAFLHISVLSKMVRIFSIDLRTELRFSSEWNMKYEQPAFHRNPSILELYGKFHHCVIDWRFVCYVVFSLWGSSVRNVTSLAGNRTVYDVVLNIGHKHRQTQSNVIYVIELF